MKTDKVGFSNGNEPIEVEQSSAGAGQNEGVVQALEVIIPGSLGELTALILDKWNSMQDDGRMIGAWLLEIRDNKLWHPEFSSFEEFCAKALPFGKRRANQLIAAEALMLELPNDREPGSLNERCLRELAKIPAGKRAEVLEKAMAAAESEGKPLTARHIAMAGHEFRFAELTVLAQARADREDEQWRTDWKKASLQTRRDFLEWVFNKGGVAKLWPGWKNPS